MCGIYGVIEININPDHDVRSIFSNLVLESESRGKEASGFVFSDITGGKIYKSSSAGSDLLKDANVKAAMSSVTQKRLEGIKSCLIGHSRLVTNGSEENPNNNQPVVLDTMIGIHNGIMTNDENIKINKNISTLGELDSEVLFRHIANNYKEKGFFSKVSFLSSINDVKGTVNIASILKDIGKVLLFTNHGSLYVFSNKDICIFASELWILEQVTELNHGSIEKLSVGEPLLVDFSFNENSSFNVENIINRKKTNLISLPDNNNFRASVKVHSHVKRVMEGLSRIKRCSKCILPETMPYISFDNNGVCSYCLNYTIISVRGDDEFQELSNSLRTKGSKPDVVVALSGGRDSTYGLHYAKNILGLNPVAYTYDWGMVSDEARKTSANICGKLGVEHIIVSADIKTKRENIGKNIKAWLKKPDLGMIPLFMAGDKQFYYYAEKVRKQVGASTVLFSAGNELERTDFKNGFCGIKSGGKEGLLASISLADKGRLVSHYMKNFLTNPAYINSSLFDTAHAFLSTYFMKHNFHYIYHYHKWNETEIMSVLRNEYDWIDAKDTKNSWRIGDGTSAFYNFIYLSAVGFTEHDTFKSNQIREGILTREEVMVDMESFNYPRLETIKSYLDMVGVDFEGAMNKIIPLDIWTRKYI
jgi:asparagine synthetase B (glutamine-hydrolysing)